uniref:EB domain-containing protein n=1 Tax=Anisakis simplex TaxID=6269 RepID=A0A0M3J3P2_ANISI
LNMSSSIIFFILAVWHMNRFTAQAEKCVNGGSDLGTNGGKAVSNTCGRSRCLAFYHGSPVMCIDEVCCQIVGHCPATKMAVADRCKSAQDCKHHTTSSEVECINKVCCVPSPSHNPRYPCVNDGQLMHYICKAIAIQLSDCNPTPLIFKQDTVCVVDECYSLSETCPNGGRRVGATPCDNDTDCNSHYAVSWECLHHMC